MSNPPTPSAAESVASLEKSLKIPTGLATRLGVIGTAGLAVAALIAAILTGNHSADTQTALIGAVATLVTTMIGRYAQATALARDIPSPKQLADASGEADVLGDLISSLPDSPATHEVPEPTALTQVYGAGEPPADPPVLPGDPAAGR